MFKALFRSHSLSTKILHLNKRGLRATSCRKRFSVDDGFKRTTADVLNEDINTILIDSYSPVGFRLNNGMSVIGPSVFFPRTVLHWNVASALDITVDSLSLFVILEPKLDLLVIGKGNREVDVDPLIRKYLKTKNIGLELLPTDQAIALHNYLMSEGRLAAAALIPPATYELANPIIPPEELVNIGDAIHDRPETNARPREIYTKEELKERFTIMFGSSDRSKNKSLEQKAKEKTDTCVELGKGERMHEKKDCGEEERKRPD